jgi:hypothetical protein
MLPWQNKAKDVWARVDAYGLNFERWSWVVACEFRV